MQLRKMWIDWMSRVAGLIALVIWGLMAIPVMAQTGGQGAISGTVTDASGAVVPNASITARNIETGVETMRTSSSGGLYNISPLTQALIA